MNVTEGDYTAIRELMQKFKRDFSGQCIGYPLIGAGLAGGNWQEIRRVIDEELSGENHALVIYRKDKLE